MDSPSAIPRPLGLLSEGADVACNKLTDDQNIQIMPRTYNSLGSRRGTLGHVDRRHPMRAILSA
jgi:hypothetical protein